MDDENLLIRVLKYATSREQFTFAELEAATQPNKIQKEQLIQQINSKHLLIYNVVSFSMEAKRNPEKVILYAGTEDHFRLLEYVELKEARQSAAEAKKYSLWAIGISSLLAISSILVALFTEINLPKDLYSELDKLSKKNTELTQQITQLQQQQLAEQTELKRLVTQLNTKMEQLILGQQMPKKEAGTDDM